MSSPRTRVVKVIEHQIPTSSIGKLAPETLALHADDHLNPTPDIAPPIHVSTNFHYLSNPDELVPARDITVISPSFSFSNTTFARSH